MGPGAIAPRRVSACLAAACVALSLAGCSFQPLHGPSLSGAHVDERLANVDVAPIPGRVGQRIRNELHFERSAAATSQPALRLEVVLTEAIQSSLVQINGDSFGQTYQVEASYRLINTQSQKVEFEGRSLGRANFERVESVYSNVRARHDAEDRAARSIALEIKTRLAMHLSRT